MNSINSNIKRTIFSGGLGLALTALVAVGTVSAANSAPAKKHNQDLEHYTKVAVKDSAKATAHAAKVSGRATGRYFARVGRAVF